MRIKAYDSADRTKRAFVDVTQTEREQLFRLKGYLEGVMAPSAMQDAYNTFLELLNTSGQSIGNV